MRRYIPVLSAAAVLILVDQLTKHWAVSTLCIGLQSDCTQSVDLVGGLKFKLAFNQGMAFSQFSSSGALIGVIGIGIVAGLLWFARLLPSLWSRIVVGLVIGGAVGNLVDRAFRAPIPGNPTGFMRGAVVDFIWTSWWPTFNVADSAVVVGGILLAIVAWRLPDPEPDAEPTPEPQVESEDEPA